MNKVFIRILYRTVAFLCFIGTSQLSFVYVSEIETHFLSSIDKQIIKNYNDLKNIKAGKEFEQELLRNKNKYKEGSNEWLYYTYRELSYYMDQNDSSIHDEHILALFENIEKYNSEKKNPYLYYLLNEKKGSYYYDKKKYEYAIHYYKKVLHIAYKYDDLFGITWIHTKLIM